MTFHFDAKPTLSKRTYHLTVGLTFMWGFFVNWILLTHTLPSFSENAQGNVTFVISLVLAAMFFGGVTLVEQSNKAIYSFVGFTMLVIPVGTLFNFLLGFYDANLMAHAFYMTGMCVGVMTLTTLLWPEFFTQKLTVLCMGVLVFLCVELFEQYYWQTHQNSFDWLLVFVLFAITNWYWYRADKVPATTNNAIDSAALIYTELYYELKRSALESVHRNHWWD